MYLEILTPTLKILQKDISSIILPGINGELNVLPQHSPLCASLQDGLISAKKDQKETEIFLVKAGLAFINKDGVKITGEYFVHLNVSKLDNDSILRQYEECSNNVKLQEKSLTFTSYWQNALKENALLIDYIRNKNTKS